MQIRVRLERINSRNVRVVLLGLLINISPLKSTNPKIDQAISPLGVPSSTKRDASKATAGARSFGAVPSMARKLMPWVARAAQRGVALKQFADVSMEY